MNIYIRSSNFMVGIFGHRQFSRHMFPPTPVLRMPEQYLISPPPPMYPLRHVARKGSTFAKLPNYVASYTTWPSINSSSVPIYVFFLKVVFFFWNFAAFMEWRAIKQKTPLDVWRFAGLEYLKAVLMSEFSWRECLNWRVCCIAALTGCIAEFCFLCDTWHR